MTIRELQVNRKALDRTRIVEWQNGPLGAGEIRLRIDRFGLTANNVTYGVAGDRIGYWKFFPPQDDSAGDQGIIPVWGVAEIIESRADGIAPGERLYGYFPMATELVMVPGRIRPGRLSDMSEHRSQLPAVYNNYTRLTADPGYDPAGDDMRNLLFPLYATSFCLADFLVANDWFGAKRVIIISASSKTAIGLAMALRDMDGAPGTLGMTSQANADFVHGLALFDDVTTYDRIDALDASIPSVIVDMSGSGGILSSLHARLGDAMRFCSNVGITHWSEAGMGPGFIRERSAMFFAPAHIAKRTEEWGPGAFDEKAQAFFARASAASRDWLEIETVQGLDQVGPVLARLVGGKIDPRRGLVCMS